MYEENGKKYFLQVNERLTVDEIKNVILLNKAINSNNINVEFNQQLMYIDEKEINDNKNNYDYKYDWKFLN